MKKQIIFLALISILLFVGLSGCIGPEQGIRAIKLNEDIDNFVNMTEKQMKYFPHLKEAILTNKTIWVSSPSEEMSELKVILRHFDTYDIYYQNEYYELRIYYAD